MGDSLAAAPPHVPDPSATASESDMSGNAAWWSDRYFLLLLGAGLALLLTHAFVPFDQFVHRGDDAFYYFETALNHVRVGFWSFDGTEPTNGVQPLWAILLTGLAHVCSWFGVTEPHTMARVFVGFTAIVQVAASMVLFHLLARRVSVGTAVFAAGAFLFPLAAVWARMWGMEASVYALMLASSAAYFQFVFRERDSVGVAVVLGLLLGLTGLSRLNAGLFAAVLLAYNLVRRDGGAWRLRLRQTLIAGVVASLVVLPYVLVNLAETGHVLPISGEAKAVRFDAVMAAEGIDSRFSKDFLSFVFWGWRRQVEAFVSSHFLDGTWPLGVRLFLDDIDTTWKQMGAVAGVLLVVPMALGRPREWLRYLGHRFARLSPFAYFAVFAVCDAALSVWLYPQERYAITRWWLVPDQIVMATLGATLAAAAVGYVASRWLPVRRLPAIATAALAVVITAYAVRSIEFYWGEPETRRFNTSWNDESYRAAVWLGDNVPRDALVGSWNAGVLGYYASPAVVNLDGLINNFDYLPYLRENRIGEYLRLRGVDYVSDMSSMFETTGLPDQIGLSLVYSRHSPLMHQDYRIYRVER